jgi:hypothetical protein
MSIPQRFLLKFLLLAAMLLGLPLAGVLLAGLPLERYLEFPPQTRYVRHAPFSWPAFFIFFFLILASVGPLVVAGVQSYRKRPQISAASASSPFPWWGWVGAVSGGIAWVLAWTRMPWFARFQPHTFSPLWFSYILVANAFCLRRRGHSLMTDRPGYFLLLFPASAAFWWFFEYLNRFVQNWYYPGVNFSPWAYFWYATLPFATVLPAVLSTREYLLGTGWIRRSYSHMRPAALPHSTAAAAAVLLLAATGLLAIGVWPDYLFPLLWISPLLIIIGLQTLMKERQFLRQIAGGDWSGAVAAALAALICGGFWEMWNYFSLAKWEYSIPFVHRFQIFEMPLLGYAGYLPFGLECVLIGDMLRQLVPTGLQRRPQTGIED